MQPPIPQWFIPVPPTGEDLLRKDCNYIGILMLCLTAGMQLSFTLLALALVAFGVLSPQQLTMENLGLDNTAFLLVYACSYILAMGLPAVVVSLCSKRRYFPLSPAKPCSGGVAFWLVLLGVGVCMLANVITNLLLSFFFWIDIPIPDPPQMIVNTPTSLMLGLFVMAVLPALLEEMVFRGYVLRTLRPYGDGFAILVSAILFALMHGNLRQIPFAVVVGLVLGWIVTATENIWLAVAVHFANNALSVILEYFGLSMSDSHAAVMNVLVIGLVGLLGFAVALYTYRRYPWLFEKRGNSPHPLSLPKALLTALRAPAFALALIAFVILTIVGMKI